MDLGGGAEAKFCFFLKNTQVAYQINRNKAKSPMQAHIMSLHTSSAPRMGSKDQNIFFTSESTVLGLISNYREWSICALCSIHHVRLSF